MAERMTDEQLEEVFAAAVEKLSEAESEELSDRIAETVFNWIDEQKDGFMAATVFSSMAHVTARLLSVSPSIPDSAKLATTDLVCALIEDETAFRIECLQDDIDDPIPDFEPTDGGVH